MELSSMRRLGSTVRFTLTLIRDFIFEEENLEAVSEFWLFDYCCTSATSLPSKLLPQEERIWEM
jgi:hypothetical protein